MGFEELLGCRSAVWTRSRLTFDGGFRVCPRRHPNLSLLQAQMRRSGPRLMHPQIIVKEIQSDDVQRNRGSRWSRKDEDKSHK